MDLTRAFCSRRARNAGVSPAGTATEATTWVLVEVPAPWGNKALAESDLPLEVKSYLMTWEATADHRRVQFIRREVNAFDATGRITLFVAHVARRTPQLYALRLDDYSDILKVNLPDLDKNHLLSQGALHDGPLFLTCTNGRRDACCAKWGREIARSMTDAAGTLAWQTTHLGGHRFAPTLLVLPHGSQYGWLEPEDAEPLVEAHRRGHLYRLDRYRGHVGFRRPAQAAAAFLREEVGCRKLDGLALVDVETEGKTSRVRFRVKAHTYEVQIRHEEGETIPLSCGSDPEPTERLKPIGYRVV